MFNSYRKDIQVIRGLAVAAIVLFHFNKTYFPNGYLGVDIFFVISGFVVTPLMLRIFFNNEKIRLIYKLKSFYSARFYRLAPAFVVSLIFSTILIFLFDSVPMHQRFINQAFASILMVGNFGAYKFSGNNYFLPNPNPLIHTWSLSVEEQIYLLIPLLLAFITFRRNRSWKFFLLVFTFITITSFSIHTFSSFSHNIYTKLGVTNTSEFSFYSPLDRIWQFTIGGTGFILSSKFNIKSKLFSKICKSIAVTSVLIITFSPIHFNLKYSSTIITFLTLILIWSKSLENLQGFIAAKLEWLGDRSYSIYLYHMPLIYVAQYSLIFSEGNSVDNSIESIIAVIISIVLGSLSYSKIENRFRIKSNNHKTNFNFINFFIPTITLTLCLLAVVSFGVKNNYWGIYRTIQEPTFAGTTDANCDRMRGQEPCSYFRPSSTKTVLLIGDSYAAQISQAVIDTAKDLNFNTVVWTNGSCNWQFVREKKTEVSDFCLSNNLKIKKYIIANKPTLIIVSQHLKSDSNIRLLKDALLDIKKITPNILITKNIPIFPDHNLFMAQLPILMAQYVPPKFFPVTAMDVTEELSSTDLVSWAQKNAIIVLSFDSLFCDKKICNRFSSDGWLYKNASHLSISGAQLTIPIITSYLEKF